MLIVINYLNKMLFDMWLIDFEYGDSLGNKVFYCVVKIVEYYYKYFD